MPKRHSAGGKRCPWETSGNCQKPWEIACLFRTSDTTETYKSISLNSRPDPL